MVHTSPTDNRLLGSLPKSSHRFLYPLLERVPLIYNESIYEAGDVINHVYFPESGIISLLASVSKRSSIEVGMVGDEGMAGSTIFLGVNTSSTSAVVQGSGFALRMKASDFTNYATESVPLRRILLRYIHSLLMQISQSAACNQFHTIDERLARWLLATNDRMRSNEFRITQEFLSNMLGVRREGVNKAAGILQGRGLISYLRGNVKIRNRRGLERAACPCYEIIKREYEWKISS